MGEDSLALQLLLRATTLSEALPANHPDSSLVLCCLSRALWRCGELEVAARSAQESIVFREEILGSAEAETAVARNNLACCFMDLNRPGEALAHLKLAAAVFTGFFGYEHPLSQSSPCCRWP